MESGEKMAIYAISDLHLSFGCNKPMNIFGKVWENYEERIKENWEKTVTSEDTVIIPGDISWGISFKEAFLDYKFLNELPGKKIILRGNHDYYFSTKTKMENFLVENNFLTIDVLHNNAIDLEECILCGARGWSKIESNDDELDKKIIAREEGRLKISLEAGRKLQEAYLSRGIDKKIIVAMHFPPFISNFEKILHKYDVKMCIYGHLHGYGHFLIKEGIIDNIDYKMVSCDYTKCKLIKIE